jgi:hypothetical protein
MLYSVLAKNTSKENVEKELTDLFTCYNIIEWFMPEFPDEPIELHISTFNDFVSVSNFTSDVVTSIKPFSEFVVKKKIIEIDTESLPMSIPKIVYQLKTEKIDTIFMCGDMKYICNCDIFEELSTCPPPKKFILKVFSKFNNNPEYFEQQEQSFRKMLKTWSTSNIKVVFQVLGNNNFSYTFLMN